MEFDRIILFTRFPTAQLFLADCLATAPRRGRFASPPARFAPRAQGKAAIATNHKLEFALPRDYERHVRSANGNAMCFMQSLICPRRQETLNAEPHHGNSVIRGRSSVNPSRRHRQPDGAALRSRLGKSNPSPKTEGGRASSIT